MRVRGARFRGIARPGDTLQTHVELVDQLGDVFEFKARMTLNDKLVMSNSFQLANIPSATLQGEQEPVNPVVTSETASGEATLPQRT